MNGYPRFMNHLWISVLDDSCFYGYLFVYPRISMDSHALTCYGFSIQGNHDVKAKIRESAQTL